MYSFDVFPQHIRDVLAVLRADLYAAAEVGEYAHGHLGRVETSGENEYTFNPTRILADTAEAFDGTPLQALQYLIGRDAVRLKFMPSKLPAALRGLGVEVDTIRGEVSDGDEAHMGKRHVRKPVIVAVPDREGE